MTRTLRRLEEKPTQRLPLLRSGRDPAPHVDSARSPHPPRRGPRISAGLLGVDSSKGANGPVPSQSEPMWAYQSHEVALYGHAAPLLMD
jgi:hypothetical protein